VAGGFTPTGVTDKVEVYDPNSGNWSEVAPLPKPLHHATMVAYKDKLYVIGGFSGGMWSPLETNYEFDPALNKWTEKAPMPSPRGALAAGLIDGKIYAISGAKKSFFKWNNSSANEVYDPSTNQWKKLAPVPTPRDHLTVSVIDGILYAIGGRKNVNYNKNLDTNEAYDSSTNQWSTKAPLPTARSGITSQNLGGKVYVFGGETGGGTFNQNEAYDPIINRWQKMEPMPNACHGLGSALIKEKIHLINGGPKPGGRGSQFHQVYSLKKLKEK
jgi:N-acetylneuraminic acid mutarotase